MAAPATTARVLPTGIPLKDGFPSKIAFSRLPSASFWEKQVNPPDVDGGDLIDISTMHNTRWHTMWPRVLLKSGECTITASYDPNFYNQILTTLVNQPGAITVRYADGSTLDFFGCLNKFESKELKEGEQPEADLTIGVMNYDPAGNVEAGPVLTSVAGT